MKATKRFITKKGFLGWYVWDKQTNTRINNPKFGFKDPVTKKISAEHTTRAKALASAEFLNSQTNK